MSPPEVWGPAVWILFHTLIEKMNSDMYPYLIPSTFWMIVRICKVLPCPECSKDASNFLAKINLKDYKTKDEFKNMLYLFHNRVNAKKHKPLFNYANMNKYANLSLPFVINNFIAKYNTKGNMKLLNESFQRSFVIKDFITWFKMNSRAFIKPKIINISQNNTILLKPITIKEPVVQESALEEPVIQKSVVEESVTQESVVEEPVIQESVVEESVVEEPVTQESVDEESVVEEPVVEESVVEEPVVEESVVEEPVIQESVVEESVVEESVVEEPVTQESVDEESVVEESVVKESVVEEPVVEESVVEEPVVEESVVEEPVIQEPIDSEKI
jgi:hypothetical protein